MRWKVKRAAEGRARREEGGPLHHTTTRHKKKLGVVGDAWERLFDETIAGLTFDVAGETRNLEATLTLMTEQDRALREEAAHEIARVLDDNVKTFARVHNTQAKEKEIIDRWRKMPSAQTGRHLSNQWLHP